MLNKKITRKAVNQRSKNAALRRSAIVDAALDEFVEKGFAATRIDDIARRAGVAKGTIYLNFKDKEALFQAIVKQEITPHIDAAAALAASGGSLRQFFETTFSPMMKDLVHTRRGAVLRMLIGEAGRLPKLAKLYYRLVIEPGLESIRTLARRSVERGELHDQTLAEFPQLLIAPMLLSVIWVGLFERFQHLDVERMMRAYFSHIAGAPVTKTRSRAARE
jgi:AcrR family transcriptional regulator